MLCRCRAFWKGFRVPRFEVLSDIERLVILEPVPGEFPRCPQGGEACGLIHEHTVRRIRERDLLDQQLWLEVPLRRAECLRCGRAWNGRRLAPRRRLTRRVEGSEAWLFLSATPERDTLRTIRVLPSPFALASAAPIGATF